MIDQLLADTRAGVGAVGVVVGPAGIGKSALLADARHRAGGDGFQVLHAVGAQLERDFAFGVVRQLLAQVVAASTGSSELLSGAAELAAIPLGLRHDPDSSGAAAALDPSSAMHGLYWLTARLADRAPTLIVVDDAHWADAVSGRFVAYLARRLDGLPILILVGTRPAAEEREPDFLTQLQALPEVELIRPRPLTSSQAAELIRGRGFDERIDDEFVAACHEATGGNPFLLGALAARLQADGAMGSSDEATRVARVAPEGVVRWVRWRLRSLGDDAATLAGAYAVLDSGASLGDAAAIAGLATADVHAAADALIEAEILTPSHPYDFVHPLVRAAIYDSMAPARRAAAHLRAARQTLDRNGPPALIAAHLLASDPGDEQWTVDALRGAAREATTTGAPGSAVLYIERALRESVQPALRAELLVELGEAQLNAGVAAGFDSLRAAIELQPSGQVRAETYLKLGRLLFASGDYRAAREAFVAGLSADPGADDDLSMELSAWWVTDTRYEPVLNARAQSRLRLLLEGSSPGQTRTERLLLAHLAYRSSRTGERSARIVASLAHRALADGALLRDCAVDAGPYAAACNALLAAGEIETALRELDRAVLAGQQRGSRPAVGWFSVLRSITQYARGDIVEAINDAQQAADASLEVTGRVSPGVRAALAAALVEDDDLSGAQAALELSPDEEEWLSGQPSSVAYFFALGRLRTAQGELQEALEVLLRCEAWVHETNTLNPAGHFAWRSEAAVVALGLGEPDRAHEILADTLGRARTFGASVALAIALRATALIDGAGSRIELLDEAVALLETSGARLQLARTLTDQGAALRQAGRAQDAIEPLKRALDLATHCGAKAVAARAKDELRSAGARPRRDHVSGLAALTPTEVRVARLAAEPRRSNLQIAETLFITRRTVEFHLTNIYRKLDITRRDQLAPVIEEDGGYVGAG